MIDVIEVLKAVIVSIEKAERNFICVAIDQHAKGDQDLADRALKLITRYKPQYPKGKDPYIGWWSMFDRRSRIDALRKAIADAEKML